MDSDGTVDGRIFLHCVDLLSCFKSSICTTLRNLDAVNQSRFSLRSLKLNKKRASGDLILPGFFRACCVSDQQNGGDNGQVQRLCEKIITSSSSFQFFKDCCITSSAGHLMLTLNRSLVTGTVIYNLLSKVHHNYFESTEKQTLCVVLNPSLLWSSHIGSELEPAKISLDQIRTALVSEHSKELLQATGLSVRLIHPEPLHNQASNDMLQVYHIFVPSCKSSKPVTWTDIEFTEKVEQLVNILQSCKSNKQVESIQPSTEDTELLSRSCNQVVIGKYSCDCVRGECCYVRNLVSDRKDVYIDDQKTSSVTLSCSLLKELARLDLLGRSVGRTTSADMLLHVTSCRKAFIQQQVSTVWQSICELPLANKQFLVTHGLVTINRNGEKLDVPLDAMDLLKLREKQLLESYVLKYGNKVEGHAWESSIRQMAVAVIKLEILSVAPSSEVKINLSGSSQEFRQATFVMYNCARLATLLKNFEENVLKGVYPALPPITEVDFSLLRDKDEWELTLNFLLAFPSVVKDAVSAITSNSQNATIHTNKICCFLFTLSRKFSSYYGRVHILGESRPHLFPTMFARLYLMKAVQQVFLTCLKLLNISSLDQM